MQSMVKFWAGCSILDVLEDGEVDKLSLLTKAEERLAYHCSLLEEEFTIPLGCISEAFQFLQDLELISVEGGVGAEKVKLLQVGEDVVKKAGEKDVIEDW